MTNIYFLLSHFQSGADYLGKALSSHPRILYVSTDHKYDHIDDVEGLSSYTHKCNHCGAITIDGIFTNQQLHSKSILKSYPSIYVLGDPKHTISRLIELQSYQPNKALRYYFSRLHRLLRLAKRTDKGIIITPSRLTDCGDVLKDFLKLDQLDLNVEIPQPTISLPNDIAETIAINFERYYYKFKKSGLPVV